MYREYWGLRESPFRDALDPKYYFEGPNRDEASARLHFLVDERQRLGLLLGEGGCGKSLLFEVWARKLRRHGATAAILSLTGLPAEDFILRLAAAVGLFPNPDDTPARLWCALHDALSEHRYERRSLVLLLDDVDQADAETLRHVARLMQADTSPHGRLSILVAAVPDRLHLLNERLLELSELRIDLEPWREEDTAAYVTAALIQAGRTAPAFHSDALLRLHELTGGVPRRVKQLAQLALLAGASQRLTRLDAATIDAVHEELGIINV